MTVDEEAAGGHLKTMDASRLMLQPAEMCSLGS